MKTSANIQLLTWGASPTTFKVHIMGSAAIHREMSILEHQTPNTYGSQARILVECLC